MDFQLIFSLVAYILFAILLTQLIKQFFNKSNTSRRLPPGPWKLPIIGSIHHMTGSLPHRALRDLSRKYGEIMHLQLGEISTIVISSPRLAEEVMKTHDIAFADRPEIMATEIMFYKKAEIAFAPYGDQWRQMRKIVIEELLSSRNVKSFCSLREQQVKGLVASIRSYSGSPINISEKIFSLTSSNVCKATFGKKAESHDSLIVMICEALSMMGGFDVADLFPSLRIHAISGTKRRLETMHWKIDEVLNDIINERRQKFLSGEITGGKKTEDLLGALLRLQRSSNVDFPVTDNNIKAVIFEMFVAGTDTIATIIEWAMSEMMKHPEVMARAQAEVRQLVKGNKTVKEIEGDANQTSYLKLIIKETLRLHPPGPFLIPRQCREACWVDGYLIPKGTRVIINAWAIGRYETFWDDAERFVPERFRGSSIDYTGNNFEYIPFGAGRRICPGFSFGLAIVELVLAQLLHHFDWTLPNEMKPGDLDMTETSGLTAIRKNKLYLIAKPYIC